MTEIRCRELVGAYAVGALEPPEAAVLADHLLTCTRCRHVLAEAEETAALLAAVPPEMFMDEPADPNDPILRRTLQAIRVEAATAPPTAGARRETVPIRPAARPVAQPAQPTQPAAQQGYPGWAGQTARSHRRRPQATTATEQNRRYKLVGAAAAAVLVLGGGVMLGFKMAGPDTTLPQAKPAAQQTRDTSSPPPSTASGAQLFSGTNAALNVTAQVTGTDADGAVDLKGTVSGLQVGQHCKLAVISSTGSQTPVGGEWVVTQTVDQPFTAIAQIDAKDLVAVEVLSSTGQMLVTAHV